ncbi:GreA/GreB family elongation factor [Sphingobacterium sp. SGG-5]|uniref:GreA/GreB family elongation factor n=1 Tax=Sphingobacterium sp. SGG-5 TaxID=2710881 RepID=UPI0013EA20B1|nr:GreA/GreB family elongation factor [Sphingobacterium sp. SGG-5]NGM61934.1 GreA/GreB family elongation factor [Sphingobacterium sp. SGG-5]
MSFKLSKEKIHDACVQYVRERMQTALLAIASAQAAGEEDTKSSAGDKYETGREMMKQEIERHQQLLTQAQQMEQILQKLSPDPQKTVGLGSLVQTDGGLFYLSIGVGKLAVEGEDVFVLSPSAPVGKLLIGKCIGEAFSFQTRTYKILEIW